MWELAGICFDVAAVYPAHLLQAAANTLLAHLVSLAFLVFMTRKVTDAYKKVRHAQGCMREVRLPTGALSIDA